MCVLKNSQQMNKMEVKFRKFIAVIKIVKFSSLTRNSELIAFHIVPAEIYDNLFKIWF